MAIPEAILVRVGILTFDILSDIIMDEVAARRKAGETTITVDELELFAMKAKNLKDTEIDKIRERQKEANK